MTLHALYYPSRSSADESYCSAANISIRYLLFYFISAQFLLRISVRPLKTSIRKLNCFFCYVRKIESALDGLGGGMLECYNFVAQHRFFIMHESL